MLSNTTYELDAQVGYQLRRAQQRHLALFAEGMNGLNLTAPQFATLARLKSDGPLPQNELGRRISMDQATVQGVLQRLLQRSLVGTTPDRADRRRLVVSLTKAGEALVVEATERARSVTELTLRPLRADEAIVLVTLLKKISDESVE